MKKMHLFSKAITCCLLLSLVIYTSCQNDHSTVSENVEPPLPETPPSDEDDPLRDSLKQVYLDELYYADEGTNVDSIREVNMYRHLQRKQVMRAQVISRSGTEYFANNKVEAEWHERGPNNEAGDMKEVSYLPSTGDLYALSSVGHIWKGDLSGTNWTKLNDDIRFNTNLLHALPNGASNRLFACYGSGTNNKTVRYSDDEGASWTSGTGFNFYDHWGSSRRLISLSDDNTLFYLVHTWLGSPWGSHFQLYVSTDKGSTYTNVWQSSTGRDGTDVDLWKDYDSDVLYLIDNKTQDFYEITHNFGTATTTVGAANSYASANVTSGSVHLGGRYNTNINDYDFFINCSDDKVFKSSDDGATWANTGTVGDNVWRKGWLVDPNYDRIYAGSFQLNISYNDGVVWEDLYTQWWEYYKSFNNKDSLHVDIMNLDYFETAGGTPFILICNHSGIHITYDGFETSSYISRTGANVTTLYDQTTTSDGYFYGGAQDKGTFGVGGTTNDFSEFSTNHLNTGDGMLGVFVNNEQSMFTMIQNGKIYVFPNRTTGSGKFSYTIPGSNKPGWINPIVGTPDLSDNIAYVAGGNLNGGSGSYLIRAEGTFNGNSGNLATSQYNYDFSANADNGNSVIKAIGVAASDDNRLYVATADATFFSSQDGGTNWTKSAASLPSGMIPWDIVSPADNANRVFIAGTGNSNVGVYESNDGGATFSPLGNGLPSATIFELALAEQDLLLFAATSDGPYVYVFEDAQWYSLTGVDTPLLDFNTVDNIGNNVIRFGTYGRGVWDLQIMNTTLVLPVSLTQFDANTIEKNQVLTTWTTEQELNSRNFDVQHATDATNYSTIGLVSAAGNSQSINRYEFLHENPIVGTNYYRLKINDLDGSFEYSDVETVLFRNEEQPFILYPTPVAIGETIRVKTDVKEPYNIRILDAAGRLLFQQNGLAGNQNLQPDLPKGSYFYRIENGVTVLATGQLVVQ